MIPTSVFHTPPSHHTGPTRRSGVSLAEVLISMGILTVGLLGAAAMFPVGGHYMQSGDIADRSGAIAQAALDDAIIRGHLNPENWITHDFLQGVSTTAPGMFMNMLSGVGYRVNGIPETRTGLSASLAVPSGTILGVSKGSASYRTTRYGSAFVIDPLGLASILSENDSTVPPPVIANLQDSMAARHFPAMSMASLTSNAWQPWNANGGLWPVRRVTTINDLYRINFQESYFLQEPISEALFQSKQDLAVILPDSEDDPSLTRWETWQDSSGSYPAGRQPRRDYSWIISVSPGSSRARDALATQPDAYPYDVSLVVFHKRVLGVGHDGALEAERLVTARTVTTGTAGGELLLNRRGSDTVAKSPFEELKTGQYVMLCGPHPLSTATNPRLFLQWYRVLKIEDSGSHQLDGSNTFNLDEDTQVLVGLRGPDWPWQPTGDLNQTGQLPNDLRVAIIPGAVAVHTKTMRLEAGSAWNVD